MLHKLKFKLCSLFFLVALLTLNVMGLGATTPRLALAAGRTVNVATAAELTAALQNALPGDLIQLADGRYVGNFVATISGTASAPITLQGSRNAILDGNTTNTGYVLYLKAVSYWQVIGFTLTNGQKALMTDNATYNLIDGVKAYQTGEEAVAFRTFSSHNTIQNSEITDTGLLTPGYGEGVYIGSSVDNWSKYTGGQPDTSDYNRVLNNHFGPNVRAEHVDLKEGTTGGEVSGNYFDGTGMSGANYADSWVDVAGNNYLLSNNTGVKAIQDGFQTHIQVTGWAANNTFRGNHADVQGPGYGFSIHTPSGNFASGNVICDDNVVTNAAAGVANIPLTACGPTATPTVTAPPTVTPTPCVSCPTATLTPTRTNTPLPTMTPTPCASCALKVQYKNGENPALPSNNQVKPHIQILNTGVSSVALNTLKARYWFTRDTAQPQTFYCDFAVVGCGMVTQAMVQMGTPVTGADFYLEVGFTGSGTIAAGGSSGEVQNRFNKNDWSNYNENDDWSFGTNVTYADAPHVTLYQSGALVWGTEPGGGPTATNTPAPTNTPTNTSVATNTPTNTSVPTNTPTDTPVTTNTPTNTPVVTPTPTNTPVATNTSTSTPVPTNTLTNTPVPPTATPGGGNPCASPTVITGGGSYSVSTAGTCFKYVNATYVRGGMFSVMNGSDATVSNVIKWYGGRNETVTNCINDSQTLNGNGAQLNNFTVAKDVNNAMYVTITGNKVNTVSLSIQNWQNGSGCSVAPTPGP